MDDREEVASHLDCVLDERAVWMEHNLQPSPQLEAAVAALRQELTKFGGPSFSDAADDAM